MSRKTDHKCLIFGLGTGRCGTRSLTKFLKFHGVNAFHEKYRLVWKPDLDRCYRIIDEMSEHGISDVGFYWLPYVEAIIDSFPGAKFICFYREKEKVIKSFGRAVSDPIMVSLIWSRCLTKKEYKLCENISKEELDQMDESTREWVEAYWNVDLNYDGAIAKDHFPDYDLTDETEYMNRYCDDYKKESERLEKQYPDNFRIFDMNHALNTKEGNQAILNFIGIAPYTTMQ